MNYLLDTCVVSELISRNADRRVLDWISATDEDRIYLSVLTIGEIHKGIAKLESSERRHRLERWLSEDVRTRFEGRVVPLDEEVSTLWGRLVGERERRGKTWPLMDSLMACSAMVGNMTLVTRNVADVQEMGVTVFDPWQTRAS